MNRLTMVLLALLLCCSSPLFADVVDATVCDVLADPASFDGKFVRITGATVMTGFDEFVIDGSACKSAGAIWLSYPQDSKGKAGPAAFVRLQLAHNASAVADAKKREAVQLERNSDFARFDSLLATPYKTRALCLGCPRYTVTATLVGRLDGVSSAGVMRDASGKVTGISGFGNLSLYRARLVLQKVSDVVPHEIDYAATAIAGDSRRPHERATPDQLNRSAAAFGAPGEDNGVMVGFGVANEVPADDGMKGTADSPDGILFHAMFTERREELLQRAIAHTGTHIADVRSGAPMQNVREAEERAWRVTFSK